MSTSDYGPSKLVLTGDWIDQVRLRPAMYVGDVGPRGLAWTLSGLIDNSVEQALRDRVKRILVTAGTDGSLTVEDDGPGLRLATDKDHEALIRHFDRPMGRWTDGSEPRLAHVPMDPNLATINALCQTLEVAFRRSGQETRIGFVRGRQASPLKSFPSEGPDFMRVRATPDETIFREACIEGRRIEERLRVLSYLTPGLTLVWRDERSDEEQVFLNPDGLGAFLERNRTGRFGYHKPVVVSHHDDAVHLDAAFQYFSDPRTQILSYVNHYATTDGGSHVDGLRAGLERVWGKDSKRRAVSGLLAVVSVRLPNMERGVLEGPCAQKVWAPRIVEPLADLVAEAFRPVLAAGFRWDES
jgi:DNA gyrase subunit B